MTASFIEPDWPAPASVLALSTTRVGGAGVAPYEGFNLAHHVGDDQTAVAANRAQLQACLPSGTDVQWLTQVHGTEVVKAPAATSYPVADAVYSREDGLACAVLTADCLPVLFTSVQGDCVAAAHAGWRGLQAGILEATALAMDVPAGQLMAWLGPAIGPQAFEVGPEVREAFLDVAGSSASAAVQSCFLPSTSHPGHYHADLYRLARLRLSSIGLTRVYGGGYCTFSDSRRFYSYRRDGQTGRMATVILLRQAHSRT